MTEPKSTGAGRAAGIGAAVGLAVVVAGAIAWSTLRAGPDDADGPGTATERSEGSAGEPAGTSAAEDAAREHVPSVRVAEHGRISLLAAEIPPDEPFALALDMPDEARADGRLLVRIVSTDGRRLDTAASALSGPGSGVRLEIDPSFLTRAQYMIEIETSDQHPLNIRRYVVEVH